jgi:hypothetical protein
MITQALMVVPEAVDVVREVEVLEILLLRPLVKVIMEAQELVLVLGPVPVEVVQVLLDQITLVLTQVLTVATVVAAPHHQFPVLL